MGMAVLGQLAWQLGVAASWARDLLCAAADLALAALRDAQLVLLQPWGLMNANGHSVTQAIGLTAEEVYLVHDVLDKPLGKLALKFVSALLWEVWGALVGPSPPPIHVLGCFFPSEQEPAASSAEVSMSEATGALVRHLTPVDTAACPHAQVPIHVHRGTTPTLVSTSLDFSRLPWIKGHCGLIRPYLEWELVFSLCLTRKVGKLQED